MMNKKKAMDILNWSHKQIASQLQLNTGIDYSKQDVQNQVYRYRQRLAKNFLIILLETRKKINENAKK